MFQKLPLLKQGRPTATRSSYDPSTPIALIPFVRSQAADGADDGQLLPYIVEISLVILLGVFPVVRHPMFCYGTTDGQCFLTRGLSV